MPTRRPPEDVEQGLSLAEGLVATMREPLLVLDAGLRILSANRAFGRLFRVPLEQIDGLFLYDLGDGAWDLPELRALLEEVVQQGAEVENFEISYRFPGDGERVMLLNARRVAWPGESGEAILLVVEDVTVQRAAEERLSLHITALEAAAVGVVLTDRTGRILWANPAIADLTGYSPEELIGQHTRLFRTGVHEAAFYANLWDTITSGHAWRGEMVNRRKDGSLYPEEMTITPVKDAEGEVHFIAIKLDITKRRRAEAALRESEERFRRVVESIPTALVMVDATGEIVLANSRLEEWFGYDRDELLGESVELLVPERRRRRHEQDRTGYAANPQARMMGVGRDLYGRRKDGSTFPVEIGLTPIETDRGLQVLATIVDISERKQAEALLREREELYRTALKNSPIVFARIDRDLRYEWVFNPHPDFSPSQVIGKRDDEMDSDPGIDALMELKRRVLDRGVQERQEITFERSDGTHTYDFTATPLWDQQGRVTHLITAALDISKRKRIEAEIRELNEELEHRVRERTAQLEATNKELEAFSYSVSHDLRAPLRSIDGFSRILLHSHADDLEDKALHYLQRIRHNTLQMGELVDDLLRFSRLSRQPLVARTVDLDRLVRGVLEELLPEHEERTIDVEIDEMPACEADPILLKQVYVNLLSNALKFTRHRKVARIRVGARQEAAEPAYFVADNGAGFDMKYADKLFGVFQRLHRPEDYEGTGVGLAIVQRIVHRHGGNVWAEAQPDQGATFYFTLKHPISDGEQAG